jgi:Ca-activated chloride channel family protein
MHPFLLTALDDRLTFGSPEWFWALLILAPVSWFFFDASRRREALLARILAPRLQQSLAGQVSQFKRNLRIVALLLAIACVILALAKPRYGSIDQEIKSRGRDVIIAIDTSRSMLSTDTAPTRLGRAKLISQDLLNLLRGDRVGLIAFAGTSFLQAPLTLDKGAVLTSIDDLDTNTIPKGGTDIASAIRLAIAAFGKGETMSRALVLMTDGEELDESAVEAAKEAEAAGIRIFTIGFGSAAGSLIPIKTEEGRNDFVRDENGRPVNSKLDATRLTEIAKETGGFYLPYGQDAASIIYEKGIVPMDQQETGVLSAHKPIERYGWPVGCALFLLSLWSLLGEGRRQKALSPLAITALLILLVPGSLSAATSGINDYQQGNYQKALKDFEQRLQSGANAPEIRFDAGAAAYKAGDFKKAADYFAAAMTSTDPKIRDAATYNLANSLVRSGEGADGKEAKLSDWNNALQHYETVLKDRPSDAEAKENREIVRKLIADLNKKEPPQKQQDKKDNKDKKDQKDQDKDKNKKDQSQDGGQSDKNDKNDKDQKDQKDNKDQKNDQSQGGGKDQKNDQNKPQDSKDSKDSKNDQGKGQDQKDQQQNQQKQGGGQGEPTPTPTPSPQQGKGSNSQDQKDQQNKQDSQQQQGRQQQPGDEKQAGHGAQPTPTPAPSPGKEKGANGASAQEQKKAEQEKQAAEAAAAEEGKDGKMSPNQARALLRSMQDEEAHQLSNQQNRAVEQPLRDW